MDDSEKKAHETRSRSSSLAGSRRNSAAEASRLVAVKVDESWGEKEVPFGEDDEEVVEFDGERAPIVVLRKGSVPTDLEGPTKLLLWHTANKSRVGSAATRAVVYGYRFLPCSRDVFFSACELFWSDSAKVLASSASLAPKEAVCRATVVDVLLAWPELSPTDFGDGMMGVVEFLAKAGVSDDLMNRMKLSFLKKNLPPLTLKGHDREYTLDDMQLTNLIFLGSTPTEMVAACTYLDSRMFLRITPDNLQPQQFSDLFNRVSFGVSSCILCANNLEEKITLAMRFVEMAALAYDECNYNCCASLVSGLLAHDIARLNIPIPARHARTLDQLEQLISMADNYACMRRLETKAFDSRRPMIPFMPMHLRDLITTSETSTAGGISSCLRKGAAIASLLDFQKNVRESPKPVHEVLLDRVLSWPYLKETERAQLSDKWRALYPKDSKIERSAKVKSLLGDKGVGITSSAQSSGSRSPNDLTSVLSDTIMPEHQQQEPSTEPAEDGSNAQPRSGNPSPKTMKGFFKKLFK